MLVLASKSPRRAQLLTDLGIEFTIKPATVDENITAQVSSFLPIKLSELKSEEIAFQFPNNTVIGADTIVLLKEKIFGKPKSISEAREFLCELSGKWHKVITGVCIINLAKSIKLAFSDTSHVKFKILSNKHIENYINSVNILDKAGAYAIQSNGDMIIEKINGSRNNIIGFPTEKFMSFWKVLEL